MKYLYSPKILYSQYRYFKIFVLPQYKYFKIYVLGEYKYFKIFVLPQYKYVFVEGIFRSLVSFLVVVLYLFWYGFLINKSIFMCLSNKYFNQGDIS